MPSEQSSDGKDHWQFCATVTDPKSTGAEGTHVLEQNVETFEYRTRPIDEVVDFRRSRIKEFHGRDR